MFAVRRSCRSGSAPRQRRGPDAIASSLVQRVTCRSLRCTSNPAESVGIDSRFEMVRFGVCPRCCPEDGTQPRNWGWLPRRQALSSRRSIAGHRLREGFADEELDRGVPPAFCCCLRHGVCARRMYFPRRASPPTAARRCWRPARQGCEDARQELRLLHFALDACPVGKATGPRPFRGDDQQPVFEAGNAGIDARWLARDGQPGRPTRCRLRRPWFPTCAARRARKPKPSFAPLNLRLAECRPGQARTRVPAGTINAQSRARDSGRARRCGVTYGKGPHRPRPPPRPDPTPAPAAGRSRDAAAAVRCSGAGRRAGGSRCQCRAAQLPDVRGMTCDQARNALRPLRVALGEVFPGEQPARIHLGRSVPVLPPGTPVSRVDKLYVSSSPCSPAPAASRTLPNCAA